MIRPGDVFAYPVDPLTPVAMVVFISSPKVPSDKALALVNLHTAECSEPMSHEALEAYLTARHLMPLQQGGSAGAPATLAVKKVDAPAPADPSTSSKCAMEVLQGCPEKAIILCGPEGLDWSSEEELSEQIQDTYCWLGEAYGFQDGLVAEKGSGDYAAYCFKVTNAACRLHRLVIRQPNLKTSRDVIQFCLDTGLLALGFRVVVLSRWLDNGQDHEGIPVGDYLVQMPVAGWDQVTPGKAVGPGLVRLPDSHDHYYLPRKFR